MYGGAKCADQGIGDASGVAVTVEVSVAVDSTVAVATVVGEA